MSASTPSGAPFKISPKKRAPFGWLGGVLCALSAIAVLVAAGLLINNLVSDGDKKADEDLRELRDIAPAADPLNKSQKY